MGLACSTLCLRSGNTPAGRLYPPWRPVPTKLDRLCHMGTGFACRRQRISRADFGSGGLRFRWLKVASGSIAAIRCAADFLRQVHHTQILRVALQPVAWLDSKCLCLISFSLDGGAYVGSQGKARMLCQRKTGAKARFVSARRERSSGCHTFDHDQPAGRCPLPQQARRRSGSTACCLSRRRSTRMRFDRCRV